MVRTFMTVCMVVGRIFSRGTTKGFFQGGPKMVKFDFSH